MRLIHQIGNRHDFRNELTSKSENIFEDMKEYIIMKENLNKIINKTYLKISNQIYCDENIGFQG